eukprot:Polyplicarium_translucidae@DN3057_c0_g1_i1.p1
MNVLPRVYLLITVGAAFIKAIDAEECSDPTDESVDSRRSRICDVLEDMTEFCKGVQNPVRGLFVRFYLCQTCKDFLPDKEPAEPFFERVFNFLLANFVEATKLWVRLQNQAAVLQVTSASESSVLKQQKQRSELRVLVAAYLVRMAQGKGLTAEFFRTRTIPSLYSHILPLKNARAQHYLLECTVQVFNEKLLLSSLDVVMGGLAKVQDAAFAAAVMRSLMQRLTTFFEMHGAEGSDPGSVFDVVCQHVSQFTGMRLADIEAGRPPGAPEKDERLTLCALLELHDSLLGLVLAACDRRGIKQNTPSRDTDAPPSPRGSSTAKGSDVPEAPLQHTAPHEFVAAVFSLADSALRLGSTLCVPCAPAPTPQPSTVGNSRRPRTKSESRSNSKRGSTSTSPPSPNRDACDRMLDIAVSLLRRPLLFGCQALLALPQTALLVSHLDESRSYTFASALFRALANEQESSKFSSAAAVSQFLHFVPIVAGGRPVLLSPNGGPPPWQTDLTNVCRLMLRVEFEDTDTELPVLQEIGRVFNMSTQEAFPVLAPALAAKALRLSKRVLMRETAAMRSEPGSSFPNVAVKKYMQFAHEVCMSLVAKNGDVAVRFFLEAAKVADFCDTIRPGIYSAICYEFLTQAILCLERDVSDSKQQFECIGLVASTLCSAISCLDAEAYDTLASNTLQHAKKLLVLTYQCRAVLICSHLFWHPEERRRPEKVQECLRKAASIAEQALEASRQNWHLLVECLQKAQFYSTRCAEAADDDLVAALCEMCTKEARGAEDTEENLAAASVLRTALRAPAVA